MTIHISEIDFPLMSPLNIMYIIEPGISITLKPVKCYSILGGNELGAVNESCLHLMGFLANTFNTVNTFQFIYYGTILSQSTYSCDPSCANTSKST